MAGSYSNSIFYFMRNLHSVFRNDCTKIHFHQQYTGIPFSPHPHQHSFCLLNNSNFNRCEICLIGVLICISVMINVVEQLFMHLLFISVYSLDLFIQGLCPFLNRIIWACLLVNCMSYEFSVYLRY